MQLDHIIVAVNDLPDSIRFYTELLGLKVEGEQAPFTVLRVTPDFTILLAPWGAVGSQHLAFAMSRDEFDQTFRGIRESGIPFGDSFDTVGNMKGPGEEFGAQGPGASVYFLDPSGHLIEIRHYGA